jgi:hypothetical protein
LLVLLLLGFLFLFGYLLFLTLVLILLPTFVSHCVIPFRLYLSFRCEEYSRTADSGTDSLHGAERQLHMGGERELLVSRSVRLRSHLGTTGHSPALSPPFGSVGASARGPQ